ncbi:MAG: ATP synthase F0 subunit A [Candidatus Niyogibacteria bacterium CG10_big_fil_rev_8_21_14_0_10_42_19]|uniref:ATP synthase subunit a n=1 Tax=Candidatus Niyogibacteria bacterium CG10_big_fil_rev_8_21_14_0_10_42_19 TaxID=1974725 RepID=A0A2H0TGZ9_9BACT|nr:MAG: ATP synthase F0 subunit A [Candidatus Niyogibacteria bacterium CG10_big_fil_rev_8_21_14_0_10_42_19]
MPKISIKAEHLFSIFGFDVTNSLVLAFITALILIILGIIFKRNIRLMPGRVQNLLEYAFEEMLNLCDSVLNNREKTEKYFPLVATIFFFVLISNWLGLLPGVGSLGILEVHGEESILIPFFRAPAADLNFTLAIALISVIAINIFGIVAVGAVTHFKKFFNFKGPIQFFIGILEFISEIAKIISFSFRLFGNVFAGEVLLIIIAFLLPFIAPLPFLFLEIFVGFIQAFVFAMLTLVFVAIATLEESH